MKNGDHTRSRRLEIQETFGERPMHRDLRLRLRCEFEMTQRLPSIAGTGRSTFPGRPH